MKHKPLVRIWRSHKYNVDFMGIPKTGSTTVRNLLEMSDKEWFPIENGNVYPVFTVMRDPVQRFVSSFNEARRRGTYTGDVETLIKHLKGGDFIDEHLLPQVYYLFEANKYVTISEYLMCDRTLIFQLNAYLDTYFHDVKYNETITKDRIETYMNITPYMIDEIAYIYRQDYDFLKMSYGSGPT